MAVLLRSWWAWVAAVLVVAIGVTVVVRATTDDGGGTASPTELPGVSESPVSPNVDAAQVDAIRWLRDEGILRDDDGLEGSTSETVTRATFATFLYRLDGGEDVPICDDQAPFDDVETDADECGYVAWLASRHVNRETEPDRFSPGDDLRRRDLAQFLYRYAHEDGAFTTCLDETGLDDVTPDDEDCESFRWMTLAGLEPMLPVPADLRIEPDAEATLGAVAVALQRYRLLAPESSSASSYLLNEGVVDVSSDRVVAFDAFEVVPPTRTASGTVTNPGVRGWRLTFDAQAPAFEVGDLVHVASGGIVGQGAAGRIGSIEKSSAGNVVTLEQVPFNDIFARMEVSVAMSGEELAAAAGLDSMSDLFGPYGGDSAFVATGSSPRRSPFRMGPLLDCNPFNGEQNDVMDEFVPSTNASGALVGFDQSVQNFDVVLDASLGSLFSKPKLTVSFSWETVTSMTAEMSLSYTCELDLGNAGALALFKKISTIPLGGGFFLSVEPYLDLSVDIVTGGHAKVMSARTYHTIGVRVEGKDVTNLTNTTATMERPEPMVLEVSAGVSVGLRVELSYYWVIGASLSFGLGAEATARLQEPIKDWKVCTSASVFLEAELGVFMNLVFMEFEIPFWDGRVDLVRLESTCKNVPKDARLDLREDQAPASESPTPPSDDDTPTSPPPPDPLADLLEQIEDAARLALAAADEAKRLAAEAQAAADQAAENAAGSGDPILIAQAADAQASADAAAAAADDAVDAANAALAAALAASTATEAGAAEDLVEISEALNSATLAVINAANAMADAVLEVTLPIDHLDPTWTTTGITSGDVWTFGPGEVHSYGDPSRTPYVWPATVPGIPDVEDVKVSPGGLIFVGTDGTVWTWAYGSPPTQVTGLPFIDAAYQCNGQNYARAANGDLWGWGLNNGTTEFLGVAGATDVTTPVLVFSAGDVAQLDCWDSRTIVRTATGDVWVWGENSLSETLGFNAIDQETPFQISVTDAIDVEIGSGDTCAVVASGEVYCWGMVMGGVANDPYDPDYSRRWWDVFTAPQQIVNIDNARDIEIGVNNWYVVADDGTVWVWGLNQNSSLGDGGASTVAVPIVHPTLEGITDIEVHKSQHHWTVFALDADGDVWAWGENANGDLGDGTDIVRRWPVKVPRLHDIVSIQSAQGPLVALDAGGTLWWWGQEPTMMFTGYDFGSLLLRPVPLTHVTGVTGYATTNARFYVW